MTAFLLLFVDRKGAPAAVPDDLAALSRLARELSAAGKLLRAGRLAPESAAVRIAVHDGHTITTDGPFAEGAETLAGFWLVEAADAAEATDLARRAFELGPPGAVDVHAVAQRYSVRPDPGTGVPFLLAFCNDPHLADCDQEKLQEMIAYGAALERDGKLFETTPLARSAPSPRVESRGGQTLVTEGPFAEAKEVIGGYTLLRATSRAEAIQIARRYPAARWGTVEVREIVEPG
ncbi:MAG: YciI family protein, partial [Myxococcota bacterium]|nr:YciI family protein [Myxococcota bacterium]